MPNRRRVKLLIDGNIIETYEGTTVLEAALSAGIYIPHLCYHPIVSTIEECGLCVVKIKGIDGLQNSCSIQVQENMSILTNDEEIYLIRKKKLTELLKGHPHECIGCPKYLNCELQSLKQFIGVNQEELLTYPVKPLPVIDENPLILFEPTKCVVCKRCVRACRELRGIGVLDVKETDGYKYVYTNSGKTLKEEGCIFCGTCVEVCPTAAIREKETPIQNIKKKSTPCKEACPLEINIPELIRHIKEGNYYKAVKVLKDKSPFSRVLSYICHRPCEKSCRRGYVNESVAIKGLKFYALKMLDETLNVNHENKKRIPRVGNKKKKIAIIGGGPSGLTAAYFLTKLNLEVTVFEKEVSLGGMMRVAIPYFRLPREILDSEIEAIIHSGVDVKLNHEVLELETLKEQGFSAILIAIGANKPVWPKGVPRGLAGLYTAVDFLRKFNLGEKFTIGDSVVVIGGGLSAVDCALTAKRLGAKAVSLFCLEDKTELTWGREEIEALESKEVKINTRLYLKEIIAKNHKWEMIFQKIEGFLFENGEIKVLYPQKETVKVICDTVIFAIGQLPEVPDSFGLKIKNNGTLEIDPHTFLTSKEGVFACGDVVYGMRSVSDACGQGRKAAYAIAKYLGIKIPFRDIETVPKFVFAKIPEFANLPRVDIKEETSEEEVKREASRCLQCDSRLRIPNIKFWAEY